MASALNILYQIFSLNYSTEGLRENFGVGCNLALIGSKENVSVMLELLGEPVVNLHNVASCSQVHCLPLPDRRNFVAELYKNIDTAIIHLGEAVPSPDYLRFCRECFPAQAKLLFLTNNSGGFLWDSIMSPALDKVKSVPNFVSDAEAEYLAAKVLAKVKEEQTELPLEAKNARPAWLAAEQPVSVELKSEQPTTEASGSGAEKDDWAAHLLSAWPEPESEPRLGPDWKSSDPLAAYIVSPVNIDIVELMPRFDSTLPSVMALRGDGWGVSFYECVSEGLGGRVYTLARDYSLLRENIISKLIMNAAKDSAVAAAASGLTTSLPLVGGLLGLFAVSGETIYITAKQLHLALLIGAIYGRPIDFFARIGELLPVVGGAWGWRILAREAVGFFPALGALAKAVVAWSGTYTVGKLSQHFYQQGERQVSSEYREYIEAEARHLARQAALDCLKSKP